MAVDGLKGFRDRHNISAQMGSMLVAGVIALVVLIVAAVALPGSGKKTSATEAASVANTGPYDNGQASVPSALTPSKVPAAASSAPVTAATASNATPASTTTGVGSFGARPSRFIPAKAPGVTPTTIYIGVPYSSQSGAGDRAIGAAGAAPSYDTRNVVNAVIDYANGHGGFGGRKLKALYYDYPLTTNADTNDQSACAFWTQDNKVFANLGGTDIRDACAEKAGGVALNAGAATAQTFKKYPHLVSPDTIAFERLGFVTTSGLDKAHYFTGKLGLVTWDDPRYRAAVNQGYMPAFKKFNIKVDQTAYIMVPQQLGALGDMTAAVSSAVAKFKSLNIDHVIIQDGPAGVWGGTGLTFEWMNQAKSQNYYPRYGQNTYNSPGWDVLPADQMNNAIAIDQSDYDKKFDQGWHVNKFREDCFRIETQAGYPPQSDNLNDEAIAGAACDAVFLMQRVINSSSLITATNFVNSVERLGTGMPSAIVYGTKLFPGRRDGGNMVRTEIYLQSCRCLQYKGAPYYSD
jgi:hypothetical protein